MTASGRFDCRPNGIFDIRGFYHTTPCMGSTDYSAGQRPRMRICNDFPIFLKFQKRAFTFSIEMTCQKRRKRYQSFRMINLLTFIS